MPEENEMSNELLAIEDEIDRCYERIRHLEIEHGKVWDYKAKVEKIYDDLG